MLQVSKWSIVCVLIILLATLQGCVQPQQQKQLNMQSPRITLAVEMQQGAISVRFNNEAPSSFEMWRFSNAWGWGSLHFEIVTQSQDAESIVALIQPADKVFTRNGPGIQSIAPHEHCTEVFPMTQAEWHYVPLHEENLTASTAAEYSLRAVWNQQAKTEGAALGVQDCQASSPMVALTSEQWAALKGLQAPQD
jgi:hypothetical protein